MHLATPMDGYSGPPGPRSGAIGGSRVYHRGDDGLAGRGRSPGRGAGALPPPLGGGEEESQESRRSEGQASGGEDQAAIKELSEKINDLRASLEYGSRIEGRRAPAGSSC